MSRRDEAGYVAMLTAILFSSVFFALAALGVDTARWYVEAEQLQKAADAAALAGVVYMPADLAKARTAAATAAELNGFKDGAGSGAVSVTVTEGSLPSEIQVTISSRIANTFGATIGVKNTTMTRTAVADYTAPAPMGSPCNTFGNEPPSTSGTAAPTGSALPSTPFPNCKSNPQFWAAVEGPATDKTQGDRYGTTSCASNTTYKCSGGANSEYRSDGYYFSVHVEPSAVSKPIDVQIYDPAFVQTGKDCESIPQTQSNGNAYLIDYMSDYTNTDGIARYDDASSLYCSGDYLGSGTVPTTTYVLREQTDTGDPLKAAVVSGCTKQFQGTANAPSVALRQWTSAKRDTNFSGFNPELSRIFHQWVSLCTFTPTRTGDYYIQVRTNVSFGGSEIQNKNATNNTFTNLVSTGNANAGLKTGNLTTGTGVNSFALRAVPQDAALRDKVAVAGYSRMPILQNVSGSTATFNLIRALPATRGQYISFSFYDVSDCGSKCTGQVRVVRPTDATGKIKNTTDIIGCKTRLEPNAFSDASNCTAQVNNTDNNGQLQTMVIPIPDDYSCNPGTLGGCWFSVEVSFNAGANVSDITTWDANIGGDPVRLVE